MGAEFLRMAVESVEAAAWAPDEVSAVVAERDLTGYRSRFRNWDSTAAVRTRPLRVLGEPVAGTLYFPPELVATYAHPAVVALGEPARNRLLIHALYQYLHFTTELEDLAVIPVAMDLSRDRYGLLLPDEARRDAHNIVTDEAWHAQFSDSLRHQIERQTGERAPPWREPMFVQRLESIAARLRTNVPAIGRLLFTVVSETLVSALLADIPHDPRLPPAVRGTVADHALDEGRHHAYFREILTCLWTALSRRERASVGPWLPSIILAFLEPDYRAVADALATLGMAAEQIEAVLRESYPRPAVLAATAAAAKPTIRYFAELGALGDPATAEAFAMLTSA